MKYQLAIFDFDGTLADSFPFFVSVINDLADRHNFSRIDADKIQELRRYSARQLMDYVGLPAWKLPMVASSFKAIMNENHASIPLFAGVETLLSYLARHGVELAIVSSNSQDNVLQVLGDANAKLIRFYECGASIFGKARLIRRVLRKSGIAPASAIYIGDQSADIEAARHARVVSGAVTWGYGDIGALRQYHPDREFSSVSDIMRIVGDTG